MAAKSYRDLQAWQLSMDLAVSTYAVAAGLPKHETYGLSSQLRRASVSIPSNIAEGYGRLHHGDYLRHLSISTGSLRELETLQELLTRLRYTSLGEIDPCVSLADRVGQKLYRLIESLQRESPRTIRPNET